MHDRIRQSPADDNGVVDSAVVPRSEFARRVMIVVGITLAAVAIGAAFVQASDIFFLFFAGVLLAILLRATADAVGRCTRIGPNWGLAVVVVVLLALAGGGVYAAGSMIVRQINQVSVYLPDSVERARSEIRTLPWGEELLARTPTAKNLITGGTGNVASSVTAFFSTTLGAVGNILVLTFLSLYLAINPKPYVDGLVRLVPPRSRARFDRVLNAVGFHLKWWLIGRAVAMATVGVVTAVGLAVLDIPGYLLLAVVAALLTAVPFFGPIVASIPAILIALIHGPMTAVWTAGVYVLAQAIDNYLMTPLIQERFVRMPPALTIAAVTLVGALFGIMGLIVATPIGVLLLVLIKTLYVEDLYGDDLDVLGEERPARDQLATS